MTISWLPWDADSVALNWIDVGVLFLVLLTVLLALFVVFLVWRHGYRKGWRGARRVPPQCLSCGYNLSGLTHCRCPECGREHRLDELWETDIVTVRGLEKKPAPSGSVEQRRTSL